MIMNDGGRYTYVDFSTREQTNSGNRATISGCAFMGGKPMASSDEQSGNRNIIIS